MEIKSPEYFFFLKKGTDALNFSDIFLIFLQSVKLLHYQIFLN